MTQSELLTKCRTRLDDLEGANTGRLFTDSELYDYMAEAQEKMAEECRVIRDSETADICDPTLATGSNVVAVSPLILQIDQVEYVRDTVMIRPTKKQMRDIPMTIVDGDPRCYSLDHTPGSLVFDRKPTGDASLRLFVRRMPVNAPDATHSLEVPEMYHYRLVNGIVGKAYLKPDTEVYSATKGKAYLALFQEDLEAVRRVELLKFGHGARFR